MTKSPYSPIAIGALLPLSLFLIACLWDYDTLKMERERFPRTLELITGKFLRHSEEFYRWRIDDRTRRLAEDPSILALYDDLAVAYDKTGQHEKAIETNLAKDAIKPGLYETEANLGTFYIHSGELEKGLEHIERALEINPNAHFGREIVQKRLVEYLLRDWAEEKFKLPGGDEPRKITRRFNHGFVQYVLEQEAMKEHVTASNPLVAVRKMSAKTRNALIEETSAGIMGMMKFGNFKSPVLLDALGESSLLGNSQGDAKRLAARAYLKASYSSQTEEERERLRWKADAALQMQTKGKGTHAEVTLKALESTFKKELAEADAWFESIRADEIAWIEAGLNADEEFSKKYYTEPTLPPSKEPFIIPGKLKFMFWVATILFIFGYISIRSSTFDPNKSPS